MGCNIKILSDITIFNKYAKYIPKLKRRETWEEICTRNMQMHIKKYPLLKEEIEEVYREYVIPKKVLPSMRSLQFGGRPIELAPNRGFNCAYLPVDSPEAFSETMFLLLGGTGVGYSVQKHHVETLPPISTPLSRTRRYVIGDSIEGWADSIKVLVEAYFYGKSQPRFDFSDIRAKGEALVTSGGKAPGPQPLKDCIHNIRKVLDFKERGSKLTTLEVHDIMCYIADAVLAGGIRRAALIALFSMDDMDMVTCKSGAWWEENPQRGRANNSAVILRHKVRKMDFLDLWKRVEMSGAGEPGIFFSNDKDWGTNPCCEIGLRPFQFCNLTEINVSDVTTQEELNARAKVGAFLGTLQAGYTDFHYLRDVWKDATEKDALIGVGMTGIGSGTVLKLNLGEASEYVIKENHRVADIIGINRASRTTCIKPSGTSSLVLGSASGIHAWHSPYYIRRSRVGKDEALYRFLKRTAPELVEDCQEKPHIQAVIEIPIKSPEGSIFRGESYIDLLERVRKFNVEWVRPGSLHGQNTNNVSCTVSLRDDEWEGCGEWMWKNRSVFNGISCLPYDGGSYVQAPFEEIDEERYLLLSNSLNEIDLTKVVEERDNTDLTGEAACAGGLCEIV
ncbi:MAG: putative ribonucleotide reductase [Prokaryotic dsDNA virus sp.]|nr:MAG: putative ribonucleotide reductase [Prokaryotic dsDNA virus sp.]|tara:strand:- start:16525 stop:18381 length:1857 start_codon:yes stop_codon:yes gene_type:complete